jgi:putative endopeptidase
MLMLGLSKRVFLLATMLAAGAFSSWGQQKPEARPLTAMPYSPSLDLSNLDRSVDPCTDFYKFTCGGWQKNNPIPADQSSWSVYAKLGDENAQFLWGILKEDAALKQRTPVQQEVGDFFNACMDTAAIDKRGDEPIADGMARLAALPNRAAVIASLAQLHHLSSGNYFFSSGPGPDPDDSSKILVAVDVGGLGLPDRDYYLKSDEKSIDTRAKYVAYVGQLFTLSGETAAQASGDAAAVLKIETALAKASLSNVDRRDPYKIFHKMNVAQLNTAAPVIDWARYFEVQGVPGLTTLNLGEPEFQKAVDAELLNEPVEALKAYLRFHLVSVAAPGLSEPFRKADFDFYRKYLRGTEEPPERWKTCVHSVDMHLGEAMGQEFVARTFSAETKAKTVLMTGQIEAEMQVEIEHLNWMSDATKKEALRKLHAVRNKVGYPDHWRDYSSVTVKPDDYFGNVRRADDFERARQWAKVGKPVDRDEWGMTPPTVNAYFDPQMNDINFPAGILQPPLYDPKLDDAPNYGNTGATIGHELTHGFDDQGRQFDDKGNLKDWWTKDDAKNFEDRINCVRDEYAGFVVVDDIHINSKLTSGEDVADLGGTLLAYMAWKQATANERLKPIDGFTSDQRFFVGMAQWACENARPENLRVQALTDPHSPGSARINGVVSNMPEFANAFSCKAGQPMVRAKACKVW